jgi:ERO1-like protein alpha
VLYKIISGLHASVSTHLSYFYKDLKPFLDPSTLPYYPNETLYMQRVGNFPERIDNLYFIYMVYLSTLAKVKEELVYYNIDSGNITEDFRAKVLLLNYIKELENYKVPKELESFSELARPFASQYQRYVHNISRIMDCVECEKCRLFGKMQTYGLGTAMKVIFGYSNLKRNELVAYINALNKISMSIEINQMLVKSPKETLFVYLMIYTWVGLCLFSFLFSALSIYKTLSARVKGMFKNTFPKGTKIE